MPCISSDPTRPAAGRTPFPWLAAACGRRAVAELVGHVLAQRSKGGYCRGNADTESRGCASLCTCSRAGWSASGSSGRVVVPWRWNRRSSARRNRQHRLLTNNANAATARSTAVGMVTSSPAISVDLIRCRLRRDRPKNVTANPRISAPERSKCQRRPA